MFIYRWEFTGLPLRFRQAAWNNPVPTCNHFISTRTKILSRSCVHVYASPGKTNARDRKRASLAELLLSPTCGHEHYKQANTHKTLEIPILSQANLFLFPLWLISFFLRSDYLRSLSFFPCRMRFFFDWSRDGVFAPSKITFPRFPIRFRQKVGIFLIGFRSQRGEEGFPAAEASALQVPASKRISRGLQSWRRREQIQW